MSAASGWNIPRKPFHQTRDAGVLRTHLELAGLDLGNVENIVDQVEQVIAGGVDRLGEFDLLGAEVFLRVFRQQLGQDQRAVQRRAQLMGHVGEEFGLVLARTLQLFGAFFELDLRLIEFRVLKVHGVALIGQDLRLIGELLIGLLKLDLLGFQVCLGLLENPRLLFQLFVGGLELFLLDLQFFVELLGFGQHFLQALAIARGFDGRADVAGNQFKQFDIALVERTQETQFDHPVDPVIVTGRHHQHAMGQAFAEAGADLEVVTRYVVEADQASLLRDLADNAFATVDLLVKRFLFPGETIRGNALETAVFFTDINSGDRRTEVLRAKLQNVAPEHIE